MSTGPEKLLVLISRSNNLARMCRETLLSLGATNCGLVVCQTFDPEIGSKADVCLWDYRHGLPLPVALINEDKTRHLFLVHTKDLIELLNALPGVGTLLRPPTRSTLAAFLQHFLCRRQEIGSGDVRSQRDSVLQCLLLANLRLQEQDQGRCNFMARTAHSLRTPLTAISGYCGLLLGGFMGTLNPTQTEVLRRMQYSIKRLSRMADAMIELGTGPHVARRLNPIEAKLEDCVTHAIHEVVPMMEEKHISYSVNLHAPPAALRLEPSRIEDVLVNLLDNACKFTPRFGSVEIRGYPYFLERRLESLQAPEPLAVERRVQQIACVNSYRVDVCDSGIGIPPQHLDDVFEEYVSYSGGRERSSGLGLTICKAIVAAHSGRIWAEASRQGGVFSFVLPLPVAEKKVAQKAPFDPGRRWSAASA